MKSPTVFKRYELKYLVTEADCAALKAAMSAHMRPDVFGKSSVCSLYFDTPDRLLVRRSNEKPLYKEKLRLRSYGIATPDSAVFLELKKKFDGVVYKRRVAAAEKDAMAFLCAGAPLPRDTQIARELAYFCSFYRDLEPAMHLSYQREAYCDAGNGDLRITFDREILYRETALSLTAQGAGAPLLPPGKVLMEVKTARAIPLWLTAVLSERRLYKTSFSKYGGAYTRKGKPEGGAFVA